MKNNVPGEGGDKEPRSHVLSVAITCILRPACRIMLDLEVEHKTLSWGQKLEWR